MRLSATKAMLERRDTIIVATVSSIYGLGDPQAYFAMVLHLKRGDRLDQRQLLRRLADMQYTRNELDLQAGTYRVRGDVIDIFPAESDRAAVRVELFDDTVESLAEFDPLTGEVSRKLPRYTIYPGSHYVTPRERLIGAIDLIREDLRLRLRELREADKLVEAQRLEQRTMFDMEMMKEVGYCAGIENYSRYLSGREPGEPPPCLYDYLPEDALLIVDESHQTIPQLGAMYKGDQSRKGTLVEYGFRLPSAKDNRPLCFEEFEAIRGQTIYVSATPGEFELRQTEGEVIEQIIRPTGLLDPEVEVRPVRGQIDDLLNEVRVRSERNERVLVTTLTKKMAESLSEYFAEVGVRVTYLHSDIDTLERIRILRDLRRGEFDVLVGINLLREGLDLPEVSLVAILDADKEGFLRSERSLIQTIGRAARNAGGKAILYADVITESMRRAIEETERRRQLQEEYNTENGITPQTIVKSIESTLVTAYEADYFKVPLELDAYEEYSPKQIKETIAGLEREMREAAKEMKFERAAELRDKLRYLRDRQMQLS